MKNFPLILIVCFLTITGCGSIQGSRFVRNNCINGIFFSGAIERSELENEINEYEERLKKAHGSLITVGHQLGNYQNYPKFPGDKKNYSFDSCKWMKESFNDLKLKGVEFDIQLGPDKQNIYIIHERIRDIYNEYSEAPEDERKFYSKNSLKKLVKEFIENEFYNKEKFLYIESVVSR